MAGSTREQLNGILEQFLHALVARDASKAPLASSARYTENGQELAFDDGVWGTASALPRHKVVAADATSGQISFIASMKENDWPMWLGARLKVEAERITEVETLIKRSEGGLFDDTFAETETMWSEIVPPEKRMSRGAMIEVSDKYFQALENHLVDFAPVEESCDRITNGMRMTNNPGLNPFRMTPEQLAKHDVAGFKVRENVNSPIWKYITKVNRRFPVIDEEFGIVAPITEFHCNGRLPVVDLPEIGRFAYPDPFRRPFSALLQEMFKVENGKIRRIFVVGAHLLPYGMRGGWA